MQHIVDMEVIFVEHGLHGIQAVLLDGMLLDIVNDLADVAHNGEGVQQLTVVIMDFHQADFRPLAVVIDEVVHVDVLPDHVVFLAAEDLTGLLVDILQTPFLVEEHDANHGRVEDRPITQITILDKTLLVAVARHILLGTDDDRGVAMFVA